MQRLRGKVVHCSRFGCVVRLEDGRLAGMAADDDFLALLHGAAGSAHRPDFPFLVAQERGRLKLTLDRGAPVRDDADLEEKIIDYLRQTAEWDPHGATTELSRRQNEPRADRLLPFEMRARREYRDTAERPRRLRPKLK